MKPTTLKRWIVVAVVLALGAWIAVSVFAGRPGRKQASGWRAGVSPGELSASHAFLANNCAACHTPVEGVKAANCVTCHAADQSLLQRQPTAFHAGVRSCAECHAEHIGKDRPAARMDHAAFADVTFRQMKNGNVTTKPDAAAVAARDRIAAWIGSGAGSTDLPPGPSAVRRREAALSCVTCHGNQDRHRGFFGADCVQCHTTTAWSIPAFRHPSPASTSCAQCHQAPPSHYMMHFQMVSMKVAGQEHARVSECFRCHQTTSWNDIKGVGWYKHH